MKLTVIELLENGNYMVEFELDGENLGEREMDFAELRSWIVEGVVKVEYLEDVEFDVVTVEDYDGEFDVNVNKYSYSKYNNEYDCEYVKTYKTLKGALNKAFQIGGLVRVIGC